MSARLDLCSLVLVSLVLAATARGEELLAGAAEVEITPPVGYRMCGYFNERLSTGVKDPLLAKALVLRQGKEQAAIVCCDLIGVPRPVALAARRKASEKTGIPAAHITIACSHSHTGPLYFGALRHFLHDQAVAKHGHDPHEKVDYGALLIDKLAEAVAKAQAAARPARLDQGVAAEPRLSFNRRFHMKDGSVRFNPGPLNPDIVRVAGPIDPDVGILRLAERDGGKTTASLTVFAMHLDTSGGTLYSGDYPKHLSDRLQKELGPRHVSLFGAGTCGDINHVDVTKKDRRKTDEIGNLLADTVIAHLPKLKEARPSLAVKNALVEAPLQKYTPEQADQARRRMPLIGTRELTFLEQVEAHKIIDLEHLRRELKGDKTSLEVQVMRLGPETAVVTLPGEVFVELGMAIKRASPFRTTLVIELANDDPAYIPTKKAFAEGSYETVNSRVQPGSGEQLVEAAVRLLKELARSGEK